MPVNVRRFYTSFLLTPFAFAAFANGQTVPQPSPSDTQAAAQTIPIKAPTSAEIMRDRISKAKAFIAVRNYNAAIYELENIRRETSDQSVQAVSTVLLMNSYLEQGDYKRAQDFLTATFNAQKTNKANAADIYNAIAGQVVKGARTKVERYRALGLMVSDRNLPLEAVTDIERMRETLELVITQAKENGKDQSKAQTAMALLEEASTSRSSLARDDYDARRWKDEVADSREVLANSRSVITNAVDGSTVPNTTAPVQTVAVNNTQQPQSQSGTGVAQPPAAQPLVTKTADSRPLNQPSSIAGNTVSRQSDTQTATVEGPAANEAARKEEPKPIIIQNQTAVRENPSEPVKAAPAGGEAPKETGPLDVGSLIAYATRQSPPVYPLAAKSMRTAGVVKVEVTIDEKGEVAEVQRATGPSLLQGAARDAVRKWRFKPFIRDGQPVRAVGFVNFNFSH